MGRAARDRAAPALRQARPGAECTRPFRMAQRRRRRGRREHDPGRAPFIARRYPVRGGRCDDGSGTTPRTGRSGRWRCRRWSRSTPTGGPRTTSRSARSTCSTTRCSASRWRPSTASRACWATGARRPGLNFIYAHMNRVIRNWDLDAIYVIGPGHGGPAIVANAYLEGTYSEVYPSITRDADGMRQLFRQFSFPGGIPSHVAPETPGSIHEGGELGYALSHAYGAAFDNPDLVVCCVVGRRRGRDRAARHELALEQVPRPGPRRRRPPDPPPQRLQDRQPDGPRPHPGGRAASPPGGLRPSPVLRRGRRPGPDAPADGGGDGRRGRRDPGDPARGPRRRRHAAPALADDRAAQPEGLDRAEGGRRPALGGLLALAPGPVRGGAHEPGAPRAPRGLDAELPAGGAVRRRRRPHPGARRAAAARATGG